jgi:hypothetical protein
VVLAVRRVIEARLRHLRHRQFRRALEDEQRPGVAVVEVVGDLARLQEHVEGDDRRADFEGAEVDDREVGQVRARERDLVAAPDAERGEAVRHAVRERVELAVGQAGLARNNRLLVGAQADVMVEDLRQVQRRRVVLDHARTLLVVRSVTG